MEIRNSVTFPRAWLVPLEELCLSRHIYSSLIIQWDASDLKRETSFELGGERRARRTAEWSRKGGETTLHHEIFKQAFQKLVYTTCHFALSISRERADLKFTAFKNTPCLLSFCSRVNVGLLGARRGDHLKKDAPPPQPARIPSRVFSQPPRSQRQERGARSPSRSQPAVEKQSCTDIQDSHSPPRSRTHTHTHTERSPSS